MNIPIENIYYLLCYAWNKLEEKERVKVDVDDKMQLLDLFAKVLINATKILLKRGIDKSYIEQTTELAGIKGKIQISQTLKGNLLFQQKTICTYDEFSVNILTNRILVTIILRLIKTKALDRELKKQLITLRRMLFDIEPIEMKLSLFKQVKIHRNNRFYGFLMNICQIIYENTLPTEGGDSFSFSDFTRDDRKMNQLFEAFVRNFYAIECNDFKVRREDINWQFEYADDVSKSYLPKMSTDITLEKADKKIIIDAKFYKQTMVLNYDREKIYSQNLYQLFSYLLNQEDVKIPITLNATGILLYPTIEREYDLDFRFRSHSIQIKTVNLNAHWTNISSRLKEILPV